MDTYSLLRQIADSWVLLAMFLFFVGVAVWVFLPSQRQARQDASQIPFRNETAPVQSNRATSKPAQSKLAQSKGQPDD